METRTLGGDSAPQTRKSAKYTSFPDAGPGVWGPEVRAKHSEKLKDAILARIRHLSNRIDSYLPPYDKHYNVNQTLALGLEDSFDQLAQLYLQCEKDGYGSDGKGGYLYPLTDEGDYSYENIKAFDEKFEIIHDLIIKAEEPFFREREGKILVDPEATLSQAEYRDLSEEEKQQLHEKGESMLRDALEKINTLKEILASKSPLVL